MARSIVFAVTFAMMLAAFFPGQAQAAHTEEPAVYPDVVVTFGCLDEQVSLNLAYVLEKKGLYWFGETASDYILNGECFMLSEPGFPAYIDRVVRKIDWEHEGEDAYVVEAHLLGAPVGMTFFFMYYGELPARAHRSAA